MRQMQPTKHAAIYYQNAVAWILGPHYVHRNVHSEYKKLKILQQKEETWLVFDKPIDRSSSIIACQIS